jgi:hypothetical protein
MIAARRSASASAVFEKSSRAAASVEGVPGGTAPVM